MPPKVPADVMAERMKTVCEMVAEGKTIRQIAAHFGVSGGSILNWVESDPVHAEHYARARESAADMFEAEIIEAALAVSPETAAADRVKIDAMKWVAARRAPKKYGERIQQDLTSSDGSMSPADHSAAIIAALARKHAKE